MTLPKDIDHLAVAAKMLNHLFFFFLNAAPPPEISPLPHPAPLPLSPPPPPTKADPPRAHARRHESHGGAAHGPGRDGKPGRGQPPPVDEGDQDPHGHGAEQRLGV